MKKHFAFLSTILVIFLLTSCKDDDQVKPDEPTNAYTTVEQLLKDQQFSGAVLVKKGNTDLLRKGFGMANEAQQIANDPQLVYRIGSVTKSFTAMAMIQLQRDGLIDHFDQPLSDFDDEMPHGDQITLRHLLQHHSGIRDYVGPVEEYAEAHNYFFEPEEILDIITESMEEEGLLFNPGDQFHYSNSNYMMLGLLIEELSGLSYHDYLQAKVLSPLGMSSTEAGPNDPVASNHAKGYADGAIADPYQMQIAYSAGDLVSTVSDLEKWGQTFLGSYLSDTEKETVFAAPYSQDGYNTIGMGWFTVKINGKLVYYHGGDIDGFTSLLAIVPEQNGIIVLLSNEQDKGEMRNLIMETIVANEF